MRGRGIQGWRRVLGPAERGSKSMMRRLYRSDWGERSKFLSIAAMVVDDYVLFLL